MGFHGFLKVEKVVIFGLIYKKSIRILGVMIMEKQVSFQGAKMEKQQSFQNGAMEKQKSFIGIMEKQKSFRIAMERQMSFGGERKRGKDSPGKRGDSPLHLAARAGNLGKVKEIIQKFDEKA